MFGRFQSKVVLGVALAASLLAVAPSVRATVHTEGTWPADEKHVTVKIDGTRANAIKKLADIAGWSVVLPGNLREGGDDLEVDVKDQAPADVLRAILQKGDFTATRSGTMITIAPSEAPINATTNVTPPPAPGSSSSVAPEPAPPAAPTPPAVDDSKKSPPPPPAPVAARTARGEDRTITGGNLRIGKDEVVHDVAVLGGNVDVLGTVTGDLAVMGGNATLRESAHVLGDATAIGGKLDIEDGAHVDGNVGVIGGALNQSHGAVVGGKVVDTDDGDVKINVTDGGHVDTKITPAEHKEHGKKKIRTFVEELGGGLTRAAMLFVFGVLVLALGGNRVDMIKAEIAARPMKSFAIGILGSLGAVMLTVILCITVIGIPVAIIFVLLSVLAFYVGFVSVLTTAGAAVLGHRTKNPYVHLGAACAAFFLLGAIPYVGGFVTAFVALAAIGTLVSTRVGGLVTRKQKMAPSGLV